MAQIFSSSQIRNIVFAGHGHSGKTSLISGLLHGTGATPRLLKVDEGNTITDYDEESIARRMTLGAAVATCIWKRTKLNLIDTPGVNTFLHEARLAMTAADAVCIVIDAQAGIGVTTHKVWRFAEELQLPVFFVVNKLDRERGAFAELVSAMQRSWGHLAVPVQLPVYQAGNFAAVADLIRMEGTAGAIGEQAKTAHETLVEAVAEGEDELMEEFFATGTIGVEHIVSGLREEMAHRRIFPILCASATQPLGIPQLLDFAAECIEPAALRPSPDVSVQVFKTISDLNAGRVSLFKVMSGVVRDDAHLTNARTGVSERMAHLSIPFGRTAQPVAELHAGDLGVVARLKDTLSFDTLSSQPGSSPFERPALPDASISYAISTRNGSDENRLSTALPRLLEEDLALRSFRDELTHEFLLAGNGQQHLEVAVSRLKRRFHVDVELKSPKIPYRETIRGMATAQGRHKKQSGGHGQFGDCHIRLEPLARGEGFRFVNEIFGGAIPRQFIPAVEKGIQEAAAAGFVAGYPVVDFQVTLLDGSYHDVDSSEMAFKLAGRKAFRAAMESARAVVLEPVMRVDVEAPLEFAGELMSDFSGRRGRICGTDNATGSQAIHAQVPMAEMLSYSDDLTSRTQGRGSFHMEFDHYDVVPQMQAQRIIEGARLRRTGQTEEE